MGANSDVGCVSVGLERFEARRVASVALTALSLLLAGLPIGGVQPAAAQHASGVGFETSEPLSLSKAQLAHGVTVKVCNGSPTRISHFHLIPTDFNFIHTGKAGEAEPVAANSVIAVRRLRGAIPAGRCIPLSIHARGQKAIDAGEYTGALVLVASGGGNARLAMTLRTADDRAATPGGEAEPATMSIKSPTPFSGGGDTTLLLKPSAKGESKLELGKGCKSAAPRGPVCPYIGNLYQNGQIVRVRVIGPAKWNPGNGVQELPVRLHSSSHPVGDFEGAVTLPGSSQPIKIKLTAKDAWWCAVIALLLGVAPALAIQLWNGRWQPKGALMERARRLADLYEDSSGADEPKIAVDDKGLTTYQGDVTESIERYASSVLEFDLTSDAYKALDASLKLAEEDAVILTGKSGLSRALGALDRQVIATTNMLQAKEVMEEPRILKLAAEIRQRKPLQVGEATKRAKQADELLPTLVEWHKLTSRLLTSVVWLRALASHEDLQARRPMLTRIGVDLWTSRQLLFEVTGHAEIAAVGSSSTLLQALARLARLAAETDTAEPKPGTKLTEFSTGMELATLGYRGSGEGEGITVQDVYSNPAGADVDQARPAKLPPRNGRRIACDAAALAVTFLVSIVTGLGAFYFSKSFGSVEDYLTVIVIGSAAQTLLKAVLNQTSILLHDFAPSAPAVPAKIVLLAPAAGASKM
jgi:hypothetical protein